MKVWLAVFAIVVGRMAGLATLRALVRERLPAAFFLFALRAFLEPLRTGAACFFVILLVTAHGILSMGEEGEGRKWHVCVEGCITCQDMLHE